MKFRYLHDFERSEGANPHLLCHFFIGSNRAEPLFAYGYGDAKKVHDTEADTQAAHTARIFAHSTYNDELPAWLKRRLRTENPYKKYRSSAA
ncbi:hypothetical protein D8770_26565 [Methylobacterium sp. DB1607]|nr:hypothetical protein [Methylobacterium sp. DB1607]